MIFTLVTAEITVFEKFSRILHMLAVDPDRIDHH